MLEASEWKSQRARTHRWWWQRRRMKRSRKKNDNKIKCGKNVKNTFSKNEMRFVYGRAKTSACTPKQIPPKRLFLILSIETRRKKRLEPIFWALSDVIKIKWNGSIYIVDQTPGQNYSARNCVCAPLLCVCMGAYVSDICLTFQIFCSF